MRRTSLSDVVGLLFGAFLAFEVAAVLAGVIGGSP